MDTRIEKIHKDLMFLAGQLLHRGAQTNDERRAAQFIRERFREYASDVSLDDFVSMDNYLYLFASYYAEFLVVSLLALWYPGFAAGYGAVIFFAYLAEFQGHRIFSRFMPQFESQNVVARFLAPQPKRLAVVVAHYDSGCAHPLTNPQFLPWLRPLHYLVTACMFLIVASCISESIGLFAGSAPILAGPLRWIAASMLITASAALFYAASQGDDIRGANGNASGVAALLRVAEAMSGAPMEHTDLWLVATGSHEAWMGGMYHFLASEKPDKSRTCIVNLEGVGAGQLHYLSSEGMLHRIPAGSALVREAEKIAPRHGITPGVMRGVPSEAYLPLSRGYQALTVMGLDERNLPPHWNWLTDLVTVVDEKSVAEAADFTVAILRELDAGE